MRAPGLGVAAIAFGAAPPDAVVDAPGREHAELQVTLLQDARLADDAQVPRHEDRAGPARAERLKRLKLRRTDRGVSASAGSSRSYSRLGTPSSPSRATREACSLRRRRSSATFSRRTERPAACAWPPKRFEDVGALCERVEHVEAVAAARGAVARAVLVERDDDRRALQTLGDLRRGQTDDASVPAVASDDGDRCRPSCPLSSSSATARSVMSCCTSRRSRLRASRCSASATRLVLALRLEQLDDGARGVHPAGGVDARPETEAEVEGAHPAPVADAGDLHQRAQARIRRAVQVGAARARRWRGSRPSSCATSATVPMATTLRKPGT